MQNRSAHNTELTEKDATITTTKRIAGLNRLLNRSYLTKWVIIGLLIGLVAGFGATAFYYMIQGVTNYLLGGITGFYPPNPAGEPGAPLTINPKYLLIPISTAIGGLAAGLIIYRFAPEAEGHGTDAAIDAFHNKRGSNCTDCCGFWFSNRRNVQPLRERQTNCPRVRNRRRNCFDLQIPLRRRNV